MASVALIASFTATIHTGAAASSGAGWPQVRFDAARTGFNPSETAINAANVNRLQVAWSFDPQEYPAPSPVVANGIAYLSCQKSKECALDVDTGRLLWTQQIGGDFGTRPGALSGGILYVGSSTSPPATLYALSASSGAILWSASADPIDLVSDGFRSPSVANGVVYAEDDNADLYAFNATTGARIFKHWIGTFPEPAYANGRLYGSGQDSRGAGLLKAFDSATGQHLWDSAAEDRLIPGAAVSNGTVYTGPFAYPASCGNGCPPAWTFGGPAGPVTQPAVANGVVYEVYADGKLDAIDAAKGTLLWTGITVNSKETSPAAALSSPVVAGGVVFVGDGSGSFEAFNAQGCGQASCEPLWQTSLSHDAFQEDPVVADGTVYMGSSDQASGSSTVYAYRLAATPPTTSGTYTSVSSTQQYQLANSNGMNFTAIDANKLAITVMPSFNGTAVITGNADLWTAAPGYNQDLGIIADWDGMRDQPLAWKESGGFGGTYSPNAATVQATTPVTSGQPMSFRLAWRTNKPQRNGARIFAGAGPINGAFSPTRLSLRIVPRGQDDAITTSTTATQYRLASSDGTHWTPIDPALSLSLHPSANSTVKLGANADLWTETAGVNQDLAILVSVDGGPSQLVAWKESGGRSGTFSPNAAFVQAVYPVLAGHNSKFSLAWKTNRAFSGPGAIHAGAGGFVNGAYSPTSLFAEVVPAASSARSVKQYSLTGSNGRDWAPVDAAALKVSMPARSAGATAVLGANADLWTDTAGINQDLAIFVSVDGGPDQLVGWKESGGFNGIYSPNAAFVEADYHLQAGAGYVFRLKWKSNKPMPAGAGIHAGAGPLGPDFSPTSLIVETVPSS